VADVRRPCRRNSRLWAVRSAVVAAAWACSSVIPDSAVAGSCRRDVVAQIRMASGQVCWSYRGAATSFVGDFGVGQRITVEMIGEASDYDPRSGSVATVTRPRDPNVEGPGGFFFGDAEAPGLLTFVAPTNGTYHFSFSPCAMWGAEGAAKICAR